jgi:hypothetical protein
MIRKSFDNNTSAIYLPSKVAPKDNSQQGGKGASKASRIYILYCFHKEWREESKLPPVSLGDGKEEWEKIISSFRSYQTIIIIYSICEPYEFNLHYKKNNETNSI